MIQYVCDNCGEIIEDEENMEWNDVVHQRCLGCVQEEEDLEHEARSCEDNNTYHRLPRPRFYRNGKVMLDKNKNIMYDK